MNDAQNITREPRGKMEAGFLARAGVHPTFSLAFARQILGHTKQLRRLDKRSLSAEFSIELLTFKAGEADNGIKSMTGPRLREAVIQAPVRL